MFHSLGGKRTLSLTKHETINAKLLLSRTNASKGLASGPPGRFACAQEG
jgi:hypothetical protein